jgi:hypothetical protein
MWKNSLFIEKREEGTRGGGSGGRERGKKRKKNRET